MSEDELMIDDPTVHQPLDNGVIDLVGPARSFRNANQAVAADTKGAHSTDPAARLMTALALAVEHRTKTDVDGALQLLRASIDDPANDPAVAAFATVRLVGLLGYVGRVTEADELLATLEATADYRSSADVLIQRAVIMSKQETPVLALAHWQKAIEAAQRNGDTTLEMIGRNGYAIDLMGLNLLDEAEVQSRHVLVAHQPPSRIRFHAVNNLSRILARKGEIAEALHRLEHVSNGSEDRPVSACRIALTRAEAFLSCRLLDEAEQAAATAYELSNQTLGLAKRGEALMLRARVAIAARQLEPALRDISAARETFEADGRPLSAKRADQLLHALDRDRAPDFPRRVILSDLTLLEALYLSVNNAHTQEEAIRYLLAIAPAAQADNIRQRVLGLSAAVQLETLTGHPDRADRLIDALLDASDVLSRRVGSTEMLSTIFYDLSGLEHIALALALNGDPLRSFKLMDAASTRVHRSNSTAAHDAEFIAQLESLRLAHQPTDLARGSASASSSDEEFAALERRIRFLSRRVETPHATAHEHWLDHPLPPSPTVGYLVASGTVWRLFTDGTTARLDRLASLSSVERLLRRFRFTFDLAINGLRPGLDLDAVRTSGRQLFDLLLGDLPTSDSAMTFRPHRFLTDVPWRLLVPGTHDRAHLNPGVPQRIEPIAMPALATVAIVIGPDLGEPALDEAAAIAAIHPNATVISGEQATVQRTLRAFEEADLVHLVGHGLPHADDPLLASVRLHDGPLTAYDLETVENSPAVVVLAACGLGASCAPGRGSAYGLPGVLLRRGALAVIGSPMVIDNALMSLIMPDFHRSLAGGATPVEALATLACHDDEQMLTAQSVISMQAGPLAARTET